MFLTYIFCYHMALMVAGAGWFALVCSLGALLITYHGVGLLIEYVNVGLHSDEGALLKFLNERAFLSQEKHLDPLHTPLRKWLIQSSLPH